MALTFFLFFWKNFIKKTTTKVQKQRHRAKENKRERKKQETGYLLRRGNRIFLFKKFMKPSRTAYDNKQRSDTTLLAISEAPLLQIGGSEIMSHPTWSRVRSRSVAIWPRTASHSFGLCKALITSMDEAANVMFIICRLFILSKAHSQLSS